MATSLKLLDGWTLADGVFVPFLMHRPMDVATALREQGLINASPSGKQFLYEEWIYLRSWTYQLRFVLPEEDDELFGLSFECLLGEGLVFLNGYPVHEFSNDKKLSISINAQLVQGENLLELRFFPPGERRVFGLLGDVCLVTGNNLIVTETQFRSMGDTIYCNTLVKTLASGKYIFKYNVSLGDHAVMNFEFIERFGALRDAMPSHKLKLQDPVCFDPKKPEDSAYLVKLSIECMGIGCAVVRQLVPFVPNDRVPTRIARLVPETENELSYALLRELGCEAVVSTSDMPVRFGLLSIPDSDAIPLSVLPACVPYAQLETMAGSMAMWPSDVPFWRLLGAEAINKDQLEQLFGVNATGDAKRCIRLTRQLQAEKLYLTACKARLDGKASLLEYPIEGQFAPNSNAIIEYNMAKRPAFDALANAWQDVCLFAQLPESLAQPCDRSLKLPIFLISATHSQPLTASCECRLPDGSLLGGVSFSAMNGSNEPLGELVLDLPPTPEALIVSCRLTDAQGHEIMKHDQLLCTYLPGTAPLSVLMSENDSPPTYFQKEDHEL